MDQTPNLALPYLAAAQAQKHVTHNEALRALDAVVQIGVLDRDLPAPPSTAQDGQRYIVPATGVAAWTAAAGSIAAFQDGAWITYTPRTGWLAWIADEQALVVWTGTAWAPASPSLNPAARVGINTTADAVNRLAVKSDSVLISHDDVTPGSGSVRFTVNKAAPARTASVLYQTGYSGRAEIGLAGDDNLRVKVSADGAAWRDALVVDAASGAVRLPGGLLDPATGARPVQLVPVAPKDLWRSDVSAAATPRSYTLAGIAGTALTLATADAEQIFSTTLNGVVRVRVWNTSKSPARPAWVEWQLAANQLRVTAAADIAGWLPGETLRLGDPNPTATNALEMIAVDVAPYLQTTLGTIVRQRGLKLAVSAQGVGGGVSMTCSGTGAVGSAFGVNSDSSGARLSAFVDVFTSELSPISNSNLLFVRELLAGGSVLAATRLMRLVGVWM